VQICEPSSCISISWNLFRGGCCAGFLTTPRDVSRLKQWSSNYGPPPHLARPPEQYQKRILIFFYWFFLVWPRKSLTSPCQIERIHGIKLLKVVFYHPNPFGQIWDKIKLQVLKAPVAIFQSLKSDVSAKSWVLAMFTSILWRIAHLTAAKMQADTSVYNSYSKLKQNKRAITEKNCINLKCFIQHWPHTFWHAYMQVYIHMHVL